MRGRHSSECSETALDAAAALDAAEVLKNVRKNRLANHSRNSKHHLMYAEALKRSGYVGDNGVVVLSRENGRRAGARSDEHGGGSAHRYESNARQ